MASVFKSHLLQMRGLKQEELPDQNQYYKSHLLQMRGLKHTRDVGNQTQCVASFTDAWIETYKEIIEGRFDGRIFYRRVD